MKISGRIGIDLGGTKIEGIVLEGDGHVSARHRVPTPKDDYDATVAAVAELVRELENVAGRSRRIGVGIPGTVSPASGLVKNANSTWLNGRPLREDLETALARPVRLANDANCFALSESADGAAAGAALVFGVILGTGVGGGLVVRGEAIEGANAIAGEWGHNPLPSMEEEDAAAAPACWCGRRGCIETYLSGPALSRDFGLSTGVFLDAASIAHAAANGDPDAAAAIARYAARLARALATVVNLVDPDVIVLGGGLSNIASLYASVPEIWSRWIFSDRVDTRLVPPRHGDASGVRGAARLWGVVPNS
jgi:fructokinase